VVVIHEQRVFRVSFYDGTWEGGWCIMMSMQGAEVVATHDKVVWAKHRRNIVRIGS
jgi:hypothetical protein